MAKPIGVLVLVLALAGGHGFSQSARAQCDGSRLVSLVIGAISVPCDYRVVQTGGRVDYFLGYIEPPEKNWRVLWSTGMVESGLETSPTRRILSVREETVGGRAAKVGRIRWDGVEFFAIRVAPAEFKIVADVPHGLGLLKALAGRYRGSSIGLDCEAAERAEDAKP